MQAVSHTERRLEGGLVALCALLVLPFVWTSATTADEFTNLSQGLRQLQGQLIYRDFFEPVAPLASWLAWGVFALVGPSLLAMRIVLGGMLVLSSWQLFRLAQALEADRLAAALPGLMLVLCLYPQLAGYGHHWVVLPLVLGAMQAALRAHRRETPRAWALPGALAGLGLLALQTDGLVLAGCLGAWLLADALLGPGGPGTLLKRGLPLALGMLAPLAVAGLYLLARGALGPALYHIFVWPLTHYKLPGGPNDIRYLMDLSQLTSVQVGWVNLPYWYLKTGFALTLLLLLPLVGLMVACWGLDRVAARLRAGARWTPEQARFALVGGVALGMGLLSTRGRADLAHVATYAAPACLVAAVLASRWRRLAPAGSLVGCFAHGALVAFVLMGGVLAAKPFRDRPDQWLSLQSPDTRLAASPAVAYLRAHARPGDQQVAFPAGGFYHFYGLPTASRYSFIMAPADGYNSPEEYQAFWQGILSERPRYVVFSPYVAAAYARPRYFVQPLTGYRLVATLPSALFGPDHPAEIYERQAL